jgi:hypothetical protein
MEENVAASGTLVREERSDFVFHVGAGDVDVHLFMIAQVTHHARKDPRHAPEFAGP